MAVRKARRRSAELAKRASRPRAAASIRRPSFHSSPPPPMWCSDECEYASNGWCNDGGPAEGDGVAYKKGPEYSPEPSPDGFFSEEGEEQEMSKGGGKDEGDLKRRLEGDASR